MPVRRALWLVSYDIADPKRLGKVARWLEKRGVRVQYSVFAVMATTAEIQALRQGLAALIKVNQDDIRIYPISSTGRSMMLGSSMLARDLLPKHPVFQQLQLPLQIKHTVGGSKKDKVRPDPNKCWSAGKQALIWTDEW